MSTPSITVPSARALGAGAPRRAVERVLASREGDPAWSRPLLWIVAVLAGALAFWGLTRNGYANTYYAEAAQAASRSWTAWLTNALDTSGAVSLDKGPLANMLMGLSGRLFGFSSFTMLLPEALSGVASVLVLHNIVKRTMGPRAAILAALTLAVTPIFVAMSRFNNPDALLVLTGLGAAWGVVRAIESGRTRYLLFGAAFVGLAFNVKMLEAYLIVPALGLAYLVAGRGGLGRRLAQLTAAGGVMAAVSFAWYGAMMLLPAADRPWVGDTTDNSWFSLIFGANGLSRVAGNTGGGPAGGPGGGFGGATGPLRLFNPIVGGQIAWLLPLAAAGLALGLWSRRRAGRHDLGRAAYLLWGGWALVAWAVFSFSQGIFHPYYTTLLAPAVAALVAGGLVEAWDRAGDSAVWAAVLAAAVVASATLAAVLLGRAAGFVPWLAPAAVGLAVAAGAALVLARSGRAGRARRRLAAAAVLAGTLALLAGPAAYSIATVGRPLTGANPLAGPAVAVADSGPGGFGRGGLGGPPSGGAPGAQPAGAPAGLFGAPPAGGRGGAAGRIGGGAGGPSAGVSKALVAYLEAHQGSARYLAAAVGSSTAGGLALQSGRDVINMGGFMGSDPAPSLAQLEALVHSGQLHYVILSGGRGGGPGGPGGGPGGGAGGVPGGPAGGGGPGGVPGGPGGGGGGRSAATATRDAWVKQHGQAVTVSGQTVYYLATNA